LYYKILIFLTILYLGLWRDDILYEDNPDIAEALKRLPQEIRDQRNFRVIRAMQLEACKRILPKEEWTKYEEVSERLSLIVVDRSIHCSSSSNMIDLDYRFLQLMKECFCRM